MDNPASLETNLQMAEIDASVLLEGETPRLIDEWQLAPKLWDAIRFEVDHRHDVGQFVLTGSAVPADEKDMHHSGPSIKIAPLLASFFASIWSAILYLYSIFSNI